MVGNRSMRSEDGSQKYDAGKMDFGRLSEYPEKGLNISKDLSAFFQVISRSTSRLDLIGQ